MSMYKTFITSKLNWIGILMILSAVRDFVQNTESFDFRTVATFVLGLAIVVIRTYFTKLPVKRFM